MAAFRTMVLRTFFCIFILTCAKIYTQVRGGRFARGLPSAMTWPLVAATEIAVPRDHPFLFMLNSRLLPPFSPEFPPCLGSIERELRADMP